MSYAARLIGIAAVALLGGCASSENPGARLQAGLEEKVASSTAICSGYVRAFGEAASQSMSLTCSGAQQAYVAHANSIAHRFSPCAFTFEPANGGQGNGRMACSNGASGPLTYDMADPANIVVAATLDDGRQMAFTLRPE
jgi:hypothetical protein